MNSGNYSRRKFNVNDFSKDQLFWSLLKLTLTSSLSDNLKNELKNCNLSNNKDNKIERLIRFKLSEKLDINLVKYSVAGNFVSMMNEKKDMN